MKLSACIIARDTSSLELYRAIASVRPLVDEVVVVCNAVERPTPIEGVVLDWFTTCNAKRNCQGVCACQAGDIVDFSSARNWSFSLATGDWLVWLDSDDEVVFEDPDVLRKYAAQGRPTMARYEYSYKDGKPDCVYELVRLMPKGLATWCYPVHERTSLPGWPEEACAKGKPSEITWKHRQTDRTESARRNLRIVTHWKEDPRYAKDPRFLFFAAQANAESSQLHQALGLYHRSYDVQPEPDYRYLTSKNCVELLIGLGRHDAAVTWAYRAVESRPDWPLGYFLLGIAYYERFIKRGELGDARASARFFRVGFSVQDKPVSILPVEPDFGDFRAHLYYHFVCAALGDLKEAIRSCRVALLTGRDEGMRANLGKLEAEYAKRVVESARVAP